MAIFMISLFASAALSLAAVSLQPAAREPEFCSPGPHFTQFEPGRIARRPVAVAVDAVLALAAHRVGIGEEPANDPARFVAQRRVRVAGFEGGRARLVVEHQISMGLDDFGWSERRGLTREIELADGRTEEVGGVPFLIARQGGGWTLAAQADRFPLFLRFDCKGAIEIG